MYFNDMFIHILAVIIFSLELKKMKNYGKWFSTPIKWKKFLSHAFVSKSRPKIQQDKVAKYNTYF